MATIRSITKSLLAIFGKVCFALLSFLVLLFLFSLFFMGLGIGIGAGISGDGQLAQTDQLAYTYLSGDKESENRLLSISIQGIILGSLPPNIPPAALFTSGITYGYAVQELLEKAARDESVKGIFLHVQTPGGTIFGSYAIFEGIKAYQETANKPVLAYIEGLTASGGIMAIVGADEIYADYGSIIGSIGVMGPQLLYYDEPTAIDPGLLTSGIVTQGGIEYTVIFAGRGKDLGNPFRRITEEELQNWQQGVNIEYDNFVRHVAQNREMDELVIRDRMGAQLFDNKTAWEYGLIDGTRNRKNSIAKLAELAEVGEDFQLVRPKKDTGQLLSQLFQTFYEASWESEQMQQIHQQMIRQDICEKTAHVSLVYYGDVTKLCQSVSP